VIRQTHTFAELDVSPSAYDEIRAKLEEAGYEHAFIGSVIDMHGIGLVRPDTQPEGESMARIELGDVARDTITGFTGVVYADTKFLHGCRRLSLQPQELKDGRPLEGGTFDEPQLELVTARVAVGTSSLHLSLQVQKS
jgi:hypothetical protein